MTLQKTDSPILSKLRKYGAFFVAERTFSAFLFRGIFFSVVAIILALYPAKPGPRPLVPNSVLDELKLGPLTPVGPLFNENNFDFNLVVGFDGTDSRGVSNLNSIREVNASKFLLDHRDKIQAQPYRYTTTLAFPIGTYARTNTCDLQLVLNDTKFSNPLNCSSLIDSSLARFEFGEVIPPGVYNAKIKSTALSPENGIAPYIARDSSGIPWIIPSSWTTSVNALQAFFSLMKESAPKACAYLLLIVLAGILFVFGSGSAKEYVAAFALLLASAVLIAKPLSGHDETAHITMLYMATNDLKNPDPASNGQEVSAFYKETADYMYENDFYRLNGVAPIQAGVCPHEFLSSCGVSEGPLRLYRFYATIISFFSQPPKAPLEYVLTGRITNLMVISFLVALIACLYGGTILTTSMIVMMLTGGFLAQAASITNDIPPYLLGFFGLATLVYSSFGREPLRIYTGFCLFALFSALIFFIDPSIVSAIPLSISILLIVLTRALESRPLSTIANAPVKYQRQQFRLLAITFSCFIFSFLCGFLLLKAIPWLRTFNSINSLIEAVPRSDIIMNFERLSLAKMLTILVEYFRSVYGSFVWGHSYYNSFVYISLFAIHILLFLAGIRVISLGQHKRSMALLIASLSGILLAIHIGIVTSIAALYVDSHPVTLGSYAKARLTAPATAVIWILPAVGLTHMLRQQTVRTAALKLVLLWSLILIIYYQPRFYFGDLF